MGEVVPFPRIRGLRRKLRLVKYDDLQVEHARKVEKMLAETERLMSGDATPCDVQPEGAD